MRSSGILMHITALPGPYGVGSLGAQAYAFVDFLEKAGQQFWQILPLTPTGYGDSPYQSCSAYAGNHYLIDLPLLEQAGLLHRQELEKDWYKEETRVDFGLQYKNRLSVLRLAYSRFRAAEALDAFCRENSRWLPDFALYMALKDANGGKAWYDWPQPLKYREADALWNARRSLKEEIRFYCFVQYTFYKQWQALKAYANEKGISIIGDVPIYVPYDSVEVWTDPELFCLDEKLQPTCVAGCPPDAFSADGQLWGNPLYRWEKHKKDGYQWYLERLKQAGKCYDWVRLDHFRGFVGYWSVPYGDTTARNGKWEKGPGLPFLETVKEKLPQLCLIAEDLGFLTEDVLQTRDDSGLPGMKVLQFAFDADVDCPYLPHNYTKNSVCYTGTHDNMTTAQWLSQASPKTLEFAKEYMHLTVEEGLTWGTIRTAMSSISQLCIVPMQDYLQLGEEARMNYPGTQSQNNWSWRADTAAFDSRLAEKICRITRLYGR